MRDLTIARRKKNQLIGKRIRQLMTERGLTQADMSRKLGIVQSTMSQYILGDFMIKPAVLKGIADVLGVTVDELVRDD